MILLQKHAPAFYLGSDKQKPDQPDASDALFVIK